ncbi:hypothetical protein [Massilia sp. CF038]|uniref:hypothetical protein n=1 Tax=Massilia sp. CF038 TaxID=1881045 RepID=UPI000923EDFD|nr:hypothetical protein [Massilia sp. CF038]SHG64302.1 hypothetical protein SAMN05428948_1412 [Massilia sp. CF038]
MKKINYLRTMLFLPFIAALAAFVLGQLGGRSEMGEFIQVSMAVGAIPLLVTIGILLYISWRSTFDSFHKWWLFAPFLMALVIIVLVFALFSIRTVFSTHDWASLVPEFAISMLLGFYCVIVGYAYVLPAAGVGYLLEKIGLVVAPAEEAFYL